MQHTVVCLSWGKGGIGEDERRGDQHKQIVSVTTAPWSKERDFSEKNEVTPSVYDLGLELANTKHEITVRIVKVYHACCA